MFRVAQWSAGQSMDDLANHLVLIARRGEHGSSRVDRATRIDPGRIVPALRDAGVTLLALDRSHPACATWTSAAASAGLPFVVAADAAALERLRLEVLESILDHQRTMLQREDEVHRFLVRIVLAGGSLRELCEALAVFFGGAAIVTTTDGRVLARAGVGTVLEESLALECFDRTGRLIVESEPVGIRIASDRTPPGHDRRALVRIVAGPSDHGLLAVFCPGHELTPTDIHMLERAATVAALAVTKEQAVAAVEGKYRAEFLRDALAERAGTPGEAIEHANSLGWDIDRQMVVVVAETDENDAVTSRDADEVRALQERFVRAWIQAVRARDVTMPVAGFSQEVVALLPVPAGAERESTMRVVADLVRVVRGDGGGGRRSFSAGVSRPTDVARLATAYDEARRAVSVGRQMRGESALTHFDELGIYRLLALVPDSADLRAFVEESLGDLATDDSAENADLRRTLSILIDTNMNVAETARTMFFHYNTLRYRIVKLEKLLGPFTTDPQLRLTLALALKIQEMRGLRQR